jgi:hypothetical protein
MSAWPRGRNPATGSAAVGTLVGAAAGAAIGAAAGNAGAGAAIGGTTGLVGGSAVGANNTAADSFDLQSRYNVAYTQCMYSRGDSVQSAPPGSYSYGYPQYASLYPYGIPGTVGWGRASLELASSSLEEDEDSTMASTAVFTVASTVVFTVEVDTAEAATTDAMLYRPRFVSLTSRARFGSRPSSICMPRGKTHSPSRTEKQCMQARICADFGGPA